jgi:hypothetical protein
VDGAAIVQRYKPVAAKGTYPAHYCYGLASGFGSEQVFYLDSFIEGHGLIYNL